MEELTPQKADVSKFKLHILLPLFFLLALMGGVIGSFAFLDYRTNTGNIAQTVNSKIYVEEESAVIDVTKKVNPAVVSIVGITKQLSFFGGTTEAQSSGTGFIVSKNGLIVTNKHVVSSTTTKYTVYINDGKSFDATIKSIDPIFDIAILKIDGNDFPVVELGSDENLQPGQTAIAIGNALGQYQNSVTVGVISAVGRSIQAGDAEGTSTENLDNVIQTDAAINPGNSGGPLLNITGQVIGMNTAVDQSGQSIGFAIPVNLVKSALDSYNKGGKITRAMLGVRYVSLTKEISIKNNLSVNEGAYIYNNSQSAVVPGSPADKIGLKTGDIIIAINDSKINSKNSLVSLLSRYQPNENVKITWFRDGKSQEATVQLAETS